LRIFLLFTAITVYKPPWSCCFCAPTIIESQFLRKYPLKTGRIKTKEYGLYVISIWLLLVKYFINTNQ